MNEPIAVLAGTLIDTRMGVDILAAHGLNPLSCPVSTSPHEQMLFQVSSSKQKHDTVRDILLRAMDQGCSKAFVYCNSLSGAVSFPKLAKEVGIKTVTPLDVYSQLASQYECLGVIAANAQGTSGIERVLINANPALRLVTVGMLELVYSIESKEAPEDIVERRQLAGLTRIMASSGAQALILGCTHFPYFKTALEKVSALPLIDPAEEMVRLLG